VDERDRKDDAPEPIVEVVEMQVDVVEVDPRDVSEGVVPDPGPEPYAGTRPDFARGQEAVEGEAERFVEDRFSRGQELDPALHEEVHEGTFAEGQVDEEEPHPEFELHGRFARGQQEIDRDGEDAST
jgi:hypothetical protein